MQASGIAPGLLIAMPQLQDPNFARSVVLMVEHDAGGSLGIVVNRPGKVPVERLLAQLGLDWKGAPGAMAGVGGPVMAGTLWLVHEPCPELPEDPGTRLVADGIALTSTPAQLERLMRRPPARLHFLLGYAGWGPGQLEDELKEGVWLHAPASSELVFDTPAELMWRAALGALGVDPASLAPSRGVN